MKLVLNNVTYHNCPVQLREQLAFTPEQQRQMLHTMRGDRHISEAAIIETCNRLEFYLYAKKDFDSAAFLADLISKIHPAAIDTFRKFNRQAAGPDAVRHLFEVAAGLDSQMLGENQILAQVKAAYTTSLECRTSRLVFHRLFHHAFRAGKAVRTHTHINCGAVSISLAAVELAKRKMALPDRSAMVIGAGENAELAAKYLLKAGLKNLIIANRNTEKALDVTSRLKTGRVISLTEITENLAEVDLLISSTAADRHILTFRAAKSILAERKNPLLIIDIAVPRDIEPDVGQFDSVTLVNIDDLNRQISSNRQKRSSEVPKAQAIVEDFTEKFMQWYVSLDIVPVISQLTRRGLDLARAEARRYAKDFGEENSENLRSFAESLVRKVLHGPITYIKEGGNGEPTTEQLQAADLINKMFLSQNEND